MYCGDRRFDKTFCCCRVKKLSSPTRFIRSKVCVYLGGMVCHRPFGGARGACGAK